MPEAGASRKRQIQVTPGHLMAQRPQARLSCQAGAVELVSWAHFQGL